MAKMVRKGRCVVPTHGRTQYEYEIGAIMGIEEFLINEGVLQLRITLNKDQ